MSLMLVAAVAADPQPVDVFARLPPIEDIALSPDGSRAVLLGAVGETHHVQVVDLATGQARLLMAADPETFLFNWCRFANADRIVCSIRSYVTLRAGDIDVRVRWYPDGRTVMTRLLAIDADGSRQMQLVPEARSSVGRDLVWNDQRQDEILSWLPDDPEHLLIQLAREEPGSPSVYRLNIYTNRLSRVRRFHSGVSRWYADQQGTLRFATGFRDHQPIAYAVRNRQAFEIDLTHLGGVNPPTLLGFDLARGGAYVSANNGADTRALLRIDEQSGKVLETLHADPEYDIYGGLVQHPRDGSPILLQYQRDRLTERWFDPSIETAMRKLRSSLPGTPVRMSIVSTSQDASRLIIRAEGNGTPPTLYVYDPDDERVVLLARAHPELARVIEPDSVSYQSRDGLTIPAYLTRPPNVNGPLPAVVLPHGGPHARSSEAFDYLTQFLVSRGYAVLAPNYRGSTGYGDRFMSAGFEQWGLAMQDDLMDGVDWMVREGIADAERICFVGGGYGGYAALVTAFKAPERVRCAVGFAPITDLREAVNRLSRLRLGYLTIARIQSGSKRMEVSPVQQANRFGTPVLLVHGDVDRTVMVDQSRDLAQALTAAAKPFQYIEQRNGDHFLSLQSHRQQFLAALDAFLAEHLAVSSGRVDDRSPVH